MSGLRIAVLTTDTTHHRYFLRRLAAELPGGAELVLNLFETRPYPWAKKARRHMAAHWFNPWQALAMNPYLHPAGLGRAINAHERALWFPDGDDSLPQGLPSHQVHSVNGPEARHLLAQARPDLALVYGTGLVKPETFTLPRLGSINAHGGLLPEFRGLDTNLWAVIEGRPQDMAVAINVVDADFDTGPVVAQAHLPRAADMTLVTLRSHAARLSTDLFLAAVARMADGGNGFERQPAGGRYFGPMPHLLKLRADRLLRQWAAGAS